MVVSHEGVKDFYKGRLLACLNYGPVAGRGILGVVRRCMSNDLSEEMLTMDEYMELNTLSNEIVSALWDMEGN